MPGTLPIRRFDLVICDIDGCLVSEHQQPFDLEALTTIARFNHRAMERGDRPLITLCSGRPQPFAEAICRLIGNLHVPCVCEMGVWLYHPGTNVCQMDPRITPADLAAVEALAAWARETFGAKGVTRQTGKSASLTLYHPDTAYLRDHVFPAVQQAASEHGWPFRISMTWLYINCDLAHVSKGTGLDRLLAQLALRKERVAGIGDTSSDLCIAQRVGFFACPANAHPSIKEHAHFIARSAEAPGVVEILESLVQ
jgi:hydroxymethylpyrimidine pyrophosphatase-like HAD family hydrolase